MGGVAPGTETELASELLALQLDCRRLNRQIELAVLRKRFSLGSDEAARAAEEEQSWLYVLDQTMTRLRAVESQLKMLRAPYAGELVSALVH
jgi:hypothetical protein